MNNLTLQQIMNGIAITAANDGDEDAVAALQMAATIVTSIVPTSRTAVLTSTSYDAIASSTTPFLVFAGLTTNVGGPTAPQFDSQTATIKQTGLPPWSLGA
jgi:hypothetical protein